MRAEIIELASKTHLQVPKVLLQEIKSLDSLDIKLLYNYALDIFSKQHKQMMWKSMSAHIFQNLFLVSY
ncbi:hypothetical protein LOK49_LG05G01453 [Camellia lanceoleosa]|uniref:Uncharacterized protein n=1 Tax=Camellia lanceoleosa TaxID=1840588 RepID=A0ACC0HNT6_9ERIC|nr:hypothetical protein LOK49_LG05G01453 [Camellia lanceoleosa]